MKTNNTTQHTQHLIKMPSIAKFSNIIKDISHQVRFDGLDENDKPKYNNNKLPKLTFTGTIKLHGTNASVCMNKQGEMWTQSKGNIITPEKDNAGFAMFVHKNKEYIKELLSAHFITNPELEEVCVYGEWAGKGIQKGVAIAEIEKTFFVFGIKFKRDDEERYSWAQLPETTLNSWIDENKNIRSIFEFKTYEVQVDFENPKMAQNKFIEITDEVEKECPVGKAFGISGVGEGVVWVAFLDDVKHTFKSKGDKHSNTRVKKLSPVDEEKEQAKIDFANYATPAWRLEQMYSEVFNTLNGGKGDIKRTGDFLRAVVADVMKEELDEMAKRGLEPKEINGAISKVARRWFMEQLNSEAGL